jgi:hypothetical protein
MAKAVIEIFNDNGKLQYSFEKSGDDGVDRVAGLAVNAMQMYAQTGGNVNTLMQSIGGNLKQQLGMLLTQGGLR